MRKGIKKKNFLNILANNLIVYEKIKTTEAGAKKLKPFLEKLITRAKTNNLIGYRLLLKYFSKKTANKLFYKIVPRYKERKGGYLRIKKISRRRLGDAAKMAEIEFV